MTRLLLVFIALSSMAHAAWQPGYEAPDLRDGVAHVVTTFQDEIVIGGDFTAAGCAISACVVFVEDGRYVGTQRRLLDALRPEGPSYLRRGVLCFAEYGGELLAGGRFQIGYTSGRNLARWDGQKWQRFSAPTLDGSIGSLVVYEGDLIAGGNFTQDQNGTPLPGIARWNGSEWIALPATPTGSTKLAVIDGVLYGGFARWNGTAWEPIAPTSGSVTVTAIDRVDDGIAFGGHFETVAGQAIPGSLLLRPDGTVEPLGGELEISYPYPPLYSETTSTTALSFASYAGDTYCVVPQGDYPRSYTLAVLVDGAWEPVDDVDTSDLYGAARGDLAVTDDGLIAVMTNDDYIDVPGAGAVSALRFDGTSWRSLVNGAGSANTPSAITLSQGRVWFAAGERDVLHETDDGVLRAEDFLWGDICTVGRTATGVFVAGSAGTFTDVPVRSTILLEYDIDPTGAVTARREIVPAYIETLWGEVFVDHVVPWRDSYLMVLRMGYPGSAVSEFVPATFWVFGGYWEPGENGFEGTVDALVVHQGRPWYARAGQVFRLDGEDEFTSTLIGTFNAPVRALLSDGDRLIVGGDFESVNAVEARRLAVFWDGSWSELAAIDGTVSALARDGNAILVGGQFQAIDGAFTQNLAVVAPGGVGLFPNGPNGPVYEIAAEEDRFVVAGDFTMAGGLCSAGIARWEASLGTVGIEESRTPPTSTLSFRLSDPAPTPFNARTTIAYELERPGHVTLRVLDASGRLVRTLVSASAPAGAHQATWNGEDARGMPVASGVFFASLEVEGRRVHRKMVLVK